MATLTVTELDRDGKIINDLDQAAAPGGDEFANTGREVFYFSNADGSSKTVTFVTQTTVDSLAVADKAVTVDAGDSVLVGPFPTSTYNDSNSRVQVTYSAVTSCLVAAFKIPPA